MKVWFNNFFETQTRSVVDVKGHLVRIGRDERNEVVLNAPVVPEAAALIRRNGNGWELEALCYDTVQVGETELKKGDVVPLRRDDLVRIFPFTLSVTYEEDDAGGADPREFLDNELSGLLRSIHTDLLSDHAELLSRIDNADDSNVREQHLRSLDVVLDELAKKHGVLTPAKGGLRDHIAGLCVRSSALEQVSAQSEQQLSDVLIDDNPCLKNWSAIPDREMELEHTATAILRHLQADDTTADLTERIRAIEQGFWSEWDRNIDQLFDEFKNYIALRFLRKEIKDAVYGFGPLEDLLRTPAVSEIMVVDRSHIYIERQGLVENSGRRFISDKVTEAIIQRIVSKVGRRIDKSKPLVDARLADGSRVNAVIPPVAVRGPCLTIRKFPERQLLIDDLIKIGSLTQTVSNFLRACVQDGRNILVSGGTGTGKTTLLNCLSDFIPEKERIITVEDTAELQLKKEHVINLETKQENIEGTGALTIRDLVKNALRMRPNRIIVGECRGPEALDMLQAMNTGHEGSMTTIHANTTTDAMRRLEVLVAMDSDLPVESIRQQVVSAIDLVVQLRRHQHRRLVTQVSEVIDIDPRTGTVRTKDLFRLRERGDDLQLLPTGLLPTFIGRLMERNLINIESFYL